MLTVALLALLSTENLEMVYSGQIILGGARTVKIGQWIKPGRTLFQLILPLNQQLKTNYLVSFSVLS